MKYDLVIFDLDGTLLDTLDDLAAAVNHALTANGFPTLGREEVRRLIGNGIASTILRALPPEASDECRDRVLSDFRAYYLQNLSVHTRPFDGIIDLLDALNAAGIIVAINSNKLDDAVQALCDELLGRRVQLALGEREGIPRKPAPDGAKSIMERSAVGPLRTLYVGDGEADIMTARNAGIDGAWVSWGYRTADELRELDIPLQFHDAESLLDYILE